MSIPNNKKNIWIPYTVIQQGLNLHGCLANTQFRGIYY